MELSLDDTPIKMSTSLRHRRKSFTTISLIKCDSNRNNFVINRKSTTLFVQEEEEKEVIAEENHSSLENLIQQLRGELQQTRVLVAELETRLELTEQTSQVIVGELKHLLSENESESHTTVVEIDQVSEGDESDDMKIGLDDDEFYISSPLTDQTHQEEISCINNELDITLLKSSSPSSPIIQHADDTSDSFNRICSALQNLINDGQVALEKPNSLSPSHQLLGLPQTETRPRAESWSSNVSSWIMNNCNSSSMVCECGSCWLCLESSIPSTTTATPKSSRANSISSIQHPSFSLASAQQESDKKQVSLAEIKKQYRKKLERRFDYRKSCDDLEMELQKLITTAISTGVEHGLMNSPVYHHGRHLERGDSFSTVDSSNSYYYDYFNDEMSEENGEERFSTRFSKYFDIFCRRKGLESDNDNNNNNERKPSKWRRYIWDYLQKMSVNFNNKRDNNNDNVEEEDNENNGYSSYRSYNSYNSSWKSSSRDFRENSNEDSSNPFPSSFTNTLNIGQNIFNFNVNLINSTTNNHNNKTTNNYFNEIDNSIHPTSTSINNYNHEEKEEKSSQPNSVTPRQSIVTKKLQSLASKGTNWLAMIGLMVLMSNSTVKKVAPALMSIAARNIIRSSVRRRRSGKDMILMARLVKYVSLLFVGWVAGRIGKKQDASSDDENNRIREIS